MTGKFRTVGASVERLEWIPGEKSKVTVTMMSKSLQGEWLGSGVGNKDRYGEILTAGSSAGCRTSVPAWVRSKIPASVVPS